ncbi:hypothetical protein BCEP4_250057 [Burkholderia cepacia]|nr:hypothetical protein BCEP4_250057 [Burkholderia cepacia]
MTWPFVDAAPGGGGDGSGTGDDYRSNSVRPGSAVRKRSGPRDTHALPARNLPFPVLPQ